MLRPRRLGRSQNPSPQDGLEFSDRLLGAPNPNQPRRERSRELETKSNQPERCKRGQKIAQGGFAVDQQPKLRELVLVKFISGRFVFLNAGRVVARAERARQERGFRLLSPALTDLGVEEESGVCWAIEPRPSLECGARPPSRLPRNFCLPVLFSLSVRGLEQRLEWV